MKRNEIVRTALGPVVGHTETLAALQASILAAADDASAPLPHAIVFAGPEGVGKFRAALWLASRLGCEAPSRCKGECPSCKKVSAGAHPDLLVLEPEPNERSIGIDRVRDYLIPRLSMRPTGDAPNVAIIRDAHKLTLDAQSALLKTLEEPSGRALIVLVTDALGALLATVRSRCQLLRFAPLGDDDVERVLIEAGIEAGHARRAAHLAGGRPGRAMRTTEDRIEERERLVVGFERCRAGRDDMEGLLKTLIEAKGQDRPSLPALYEWQMKKLEAALGYRRTEDSDKLAKILSSLTENDAPRMIRDAERVHDTLLLLERNANARLAIRDMLMGIREP